MDSAFAEIKLKLITPNGCISACGQVKNFIGIKSAQWVEWRLKKLLILAGLRVLSHPSQSVAVLSALNARTDGGSIVHTLDYDV